MKRGMVGLAGMLLMACGLCARAQGVSVVPTYNKIVVLMLENHSFDQITGTNSFLGTPLPYVNNTLIRGGALMTQAYGLQHPSQPNYYWLFSGDNQSVVSDAVPVTNAVSQVASTRPNLATSLASSSKTFGAFVEGLNQSNSVNSTYSNLTQTGTNFAHGSIAYATNSPAHITNEHGTIENVARHMPWFGFENLESQWGTITQPFSNFTSTNFSALPDVSFVIPALEHQMHNYTFGSDVSNTNNSAVAMANADYWMEHGDHVANGGGIETPTIAAYARWALQNNSLLIVLTDEDSSADWITPGVGPSGGINYTVDDSYAITATNVSPAFTAPNLGPNEINTFPSGQPQTGSNQIFTLFYGANVMPGSYSDGITAVNVLRTIEASMGLTNPLGAQPDWMLTNGVVPMNDLAVTSVFVPEARTCLLVTFSIVALAGCRTLAPRFKLKKSKST